MRFLYLLILIVSVSFFGTKSLAQTADTNEIIAAHTAFETKANRKTRKALIEALQLYSGVPTTETVQAHMAVFLSDAATTKYVQMRESALLTAEHLEPVSHILPQQFAEAKYIAAIALFNHRQKSDAILEMAHVEGFTRQIFYADVERPDWADDLRWKSEAWRLAMEAYFVSAQKKNPTAAEVDLILSSYGYDEPDSETSTEPEDALPHCPGELLQKPKLRYPSSMGRRGMFGSVILGFGFDETGHIIDAKVLASVPIEGFAEKALAITQKWRFEPKDPDQVGVTCRLKYDNVILPVTFQIQ